jgi:hypothetical protein
MPERAAVAKKRSLPLGRGSVSGRRIDRFVRFGLIAAPASPAGGIGGRGPIADTLAGADASR